eukprot:SAG11_NODE_1378_length_5084_cov_3.339619_6_plen_121_part_00
MTPLVVSIKKLSAAEVRSFRALVAVRPEGGLHLRWMLSWGAGGSVERTAQVGSDAHAAIIAATANLYRSQTPLLLLLLEMVRPCKSEPDCAVPFAPRWPASSAATQRTTEPLHDASHRCR